jgi:hypothetical protein
MLSVQSWPDIFDKDVTERIVDGIGEMPAFWRDYFNVEATDELYTKTAGFSGFGRMGAWKDGEDLPLDEPVKQYDNQITQEFFGSGFVVSRKMVKYGQSRHVMRWADALVLSLADLYGSRHARILNNAFTTTYASLGTRALIANNQIASGSATRSNILASSALTPANLETLIVQGLNMTDYRGKRAMLRYTKLIIPPSLRRTAVKILQSEGESGTTDNDINTQRGMFRIVVDPFLDGSATHWFLQADRHGLLSLHGMAPTPKRYVSESDEKLVHGLAADFATGVEFFEGIAGSQGA